MADCTKDNTHSFEGRYDVLTEKDGEKIWEWANTGEVPKEKIPPFEPARPSETSVEDVYEQITTAFQDKINSGVNKDDVYQLIESICGKKNFKQIKDIKIAMNILEAVKLM